MMNDPMDLLESNATRKRATPGPLPDPWPNMVVSYDQGDGKWSRGVIVAAFEHDCCDEQEEGPDLEYVGVSVVFAGAEGDDPTAWTVDTILEVRSPSGAVLWRRDV